MKIVLNKCYGGFHPSDEVVKACGNEWAHQVDRCNPTLINLMEQEGAAYCSGHFSNLELVEIPEEATDWELNEYDGWESITYVVNGKLYHI